MLSQFLESGNKVSFHLFGPVSVANDELSGSATSKNLSPLPFLGSTPLNYEGQLLYIDCL